MLDSRSESLTPFGQQSHLTVKSQRHAGKASIPRRMQDVGALQADGAGTCQRKLLAVFCHHVQGRIVLKAKDRL